MCTSSVSLDIRLIRLLGSQGMTENINMDLILVVLTIAVAFGAYAIKRLNDSVKSYSKSHGKELGKIEATSQKLDVVHKQLAQSVEITESIKKDIEQGAWRERELELLKREKLEQYLVNYYETVENLSRKMKRDFFYDETHIDESCEAILSMLQKLYLPEIDAEHCSYLIASANFKTWHADGLRELAEKRKAGDGKPVISSEHMKRYSQLLEEVNAATLLIEAKAEEIGRTINVA